MRMTAAVLGTLLLGAPAFARSTLPLEPRSGEAVVRDEAVRETAQRDVQAIPGLVTRASPAAPPPSLVPGPMAQGPTPPVPPFPTAATLTPSTIAGTTGLVPSTTGGMSPLFRPAVAGAPLIIPPGLSTNVTTDFGPPAAPFAPPVRAPVPSFVTGDPSRFANTNAR